MRNAMVFASDLRQPQNLDKQLLQESGLSKDVGLAMVELLQVLPCTTSIVFEHTILYALCTTTHVICNCPLGVL